MPVSYATPSISDVPAIYVIHENADWTGLLFAAFEAAGLAYHDWNLAAAPEGVFYNRMSASSHSRGHRYAPEMTASVLAWLEGQGRMVINGRSALHLEVAKTIQYAALQKAGLAVPKTIAATTDKDIIEAFSQCAIIPLTNSLIRLCEGARI